MGNLAIALIIKLTGAQNVIYINENKDVKLNENIDKDVMIIGSAWGRTGTSSLQQALQILGYPCYHMRELVKNTDFQIFEQLGALKLELKQENIENGDTETPWNDTIINDYDWDKVFKDKGYSACLDEPACAFYKELMAYYPKYKVIHNVRDAAKWYDSAIATIMKQNLILKKRWLYRLLFGNAIQAYWNCVGDYIFDDRLEDKAFIMKRYNNWNNEVINYVPKDRLLLFDVKSGWEPLCKFLEIEEVPDVPFPHSNERSMILNANKKMELVANLVNIGLVITGIALIITIIILFSKE